MFQQDPHSEEALQKNNPKVHPKIYDYDVQNFHPNFLSQVFKQYIQLF